MEKIKTRQGLNIVTIVDCSVRKMASINMLKKCGIHVVNEAVVAADLFNYQGPRQEELVDYPDQNSVANNLLQ